MRTIGLSVCRRTRQARRTALHAPHRRCGRRIWRRPPPMRRSTTTGTSRCPTRHRRATRGRTSSIRTASVRSSPV